MLWYAPLILIQNPDGLMVLGTLFMSQPVQQVQTIYTELAFHSPVFTVKLGRTEVIFFRGVPWQV